MTFGDFIKDELSSILLQILCAIILTIYLCSLSLDIGECVLILIAWIVIASLYYFYKYYRTNLIFKKWSSILQSLERKYLLGETISNYGSFQLELFIQILRSSLKSMTQEVSKVQIEKKEYQELIEKWAHELKAPIASITLVCENNPSELSRKILLQANRLSYNVEQVLYYARLGYMSNDYMIKRVSLEDIIHTAILNNKQLLIQNQFSIEVHTVDSFVYTDTKTSVYKGYKQDKIEMRGDRAEMSDFPLYLNTVAGGLDRRDQTIGGFSFVVKIYAVPVVEIIG